MCVCVCVRCAAHSWRPHYFNEQSWLGRRALCEPTTATTRPCRIPTGLPPTFRNKEESNTAVITKGRHRQAIYLGALNHHRRNPPGPGDTLNKKLTLPARPLALRNHT